MAEGEDDKKADEGRLKGLRSAVAKAMEEFKKSHPGAEGSAYIKHGNNRHSFDTDGNVNPDPNSGDSFPGSLGPQTPTDMQTVARKIYPGHA